MTWKELLAHIQKMNDEQLETDATVYDTESDEYYPVSGMGYTGKEADVLDPNHPYLSFGETKVEKKTYYAGILKVCRGSFESQYYYLVDAETHVDASMKMDKYARQFGNRVKSMDHLSPGTYFYENGEVSVTPFVADAKFTIEEWVKLRPSQFI